MKSLITLILGAAVLAGCAGAEVWQRDGTSQQVATADIAACRTQAARDGYGTGVSGYNYLHRCMASLGYHASVW